MCSIKDDLSKGIIDPKTGRYEFETSDIAKYYPGQYTFEITGSIGSKSVSITFVLTLVDPCPDVMLHINEPDPFQNKTYILGEP